MRWFRKINTPHKRELLLKRFIARTRRLRMAVVGFVGTIALIATGLFALTELVGPRTTESSPTPGGGATSAEVRFALLVSQACNAGNHYSHDTVRIASKLQAGLRAAHSSTQAKGEVLQAINTLANNTTDIESILASATPPPADRINQQATVAALKRNASRLRQYGLQLNLAVTPQQTYTVLRTTGGMIQAIAADHALTRSKLLAIGGGDCRLDPIPTPVPVFAPAIYAAARGATNSVPVSNPFSGSTPTATAESKPDSAVTPDSSSRQRAPKSPVNHKGRAKNKTAPPQPANGGTPAPEIPLPETPPIPFPTQAPPINAPPNTSPVAEQETPAHGAETFTSYREPYGVGPIIPAGQWVQVACRVYSPTDPRGLPEDFWYLIASEPWNSAYLAPSNTFLNGDPEGGPYIHHTDLTVAICVE